VSRPAPKVGEVRVVLHHTDIDKGEPVTTREEWIRR